MPADIVQPHILPMPLTAAASFPGKQNPDDPASKVPSPRVDKNDAG